MRYKIFFIFFLFLAAGASVFATAQEPGGPWGKYLELSKYAGSPKVRDAGKFFMLKLQSPAKLQDLQEKGFKIIRPLDEYHFIVIQDEGEEGLRQSTLPAALFPVNNDWKLSPQLQSPPKVGEVEKNSLFTVKVQEVKSFKKKIGLLAKEVELISAYEQAQILMIRCSHKVLLNSILPMPEVTFADKAGSKAKEESILPDANLLVNRINLLHHEYPFLNGTGITISIKEQMFDPNDLDIRGRYIPTDQESPHNSRHATEIATFLAGGGNSSPKSKGVAWGATLASSDYQELFPDPDNYFSAHSIAIQNHSYGTAVENFYGAQANGYDIQANRDPQLVHVFSAGNEGLLADTLGTYKGVQAFANLSGNFKMAKNVMVVGALDSLKKLDELVSRGPAYDGRVKPEVVAYSAGGSSNAAALVSGVVGLLQQAYQQQNKSLPPSALVKTVLVNSAEDVGPKGIDYYSGYGSVNAYDAYKILLQGKYFEGSVGQQEEVFFSFTIPANARNLKISLGWNDPAAEPNAAKALINDLDLSLYQESSGKKWLPWVLNSYPHPDSLKQPALRKEDHLNTLEQISILTPQQGTYTLKVAGYDVPVGVQQFFVAYQWEEANNFRWTYPTGSDQLPYFGEKNSIIQWETSFTSGKGTLEYSTDKGKSWKLVAEEVDLSREYYQWNAPDAFTPALLRMTMGDSLFVSEPFLISHAPRPAVGFNCSDSVMLSWRRIEGAKAYQLYSMGHQYLEPFAVVQDTFLVFQKEKAPAKEFAVAPVWDDVVGSRSTTFNYALQGIDCFLASFNARVEEGGVQLNLGLGTYYQVSKVHFERKAGNSFQPIQTFGPVNQVKFQYLDAEVQQGMNEYRVRLELGNAQELTTEAIPIYFLTELPFLVFPNPISRHEALQIFSKDFGDENVHFALFTQQGQVVLEMDLYFDQESISIQSLRPGIYLYTLSTDGIKRTGKIMVF